MLIRHIIGLLGIAPTLGVMGIYGVESPDGPIDHPTAGVVAISEFGHQVVMPELTVADLHEATRSGVNVLGLQVGDAVDFVLDDTAVRVEQVTPFCTRAMTSSPPSLGTPTAHPWIGRATATVGVTQATNCGNATNYEGYLLWGSGLTRTAAQTRGVTVPAGQTATRTVARECTNANQHSFQSLVHWAEGLVLTNSQSSNVVTLRCGF